VRAFASQFTALRRRLERRSPQSESLCGTIMTGTLFAPVLERMMKRLNNRFGARLRVVGVENRYFGGDVSVAGLLTGGDLLASRQEVRGDFIIIPRTMLKSDEEVMLDGLRLDQLEAQMGRPIKALDFRSFSALLAGESDYVRSSMRASERGVAVA